MLINLPDAFGMRLKQIAGDNTEQFLNALSNTRVSSIRLNTLRADPKQILQHFDELGIQLRPFSDIDNAYLVDNLHGYILSALTDHKQGAFYIQSLSSQLVAPIVQPQPDELILDMCAAPGSKTSHLAQLMHNEGRIVANDLSRERLKKLREVLALLHVQNTTILNLPGEILARHYENTFDRVLLDAPCSMEGRINLQEPETYANWSIRRISDLSKRQKKLLQSAYKCLKPGGTLVYSTCTLAPEENEEVIDWLLHTYENTLEVLPIHLQVASAPCLQQWQGKTYDNEVTKCLRILPSIEMEGFFIAKLRKTEIPSSKA